MSSKVEAREKEVKLAHLLLRFGVTSEANVFPDGRVPVPNLLTSAQVVSRRPGWLEWFGIVEHGGTVKATTYRNSTPSGGNTRSSNASAVQQESVSVVERDASPTVSSPASACEVVVNPERLAPSIAEKRQALLTSERDIHQALVSLEHTRRRYLMPSNTIPCTAQLDEYARCLYYIERMRRETKETTIWNSQLRCEPYVARLEKCVSNAADRHVASLDAQPNEGRPPQE